MAQLTWPPRISSKLRAGNQELTAGWDSDGDGVDDTSVYFSIPTWMWRNQSDQPDSNAAYTTPATSNWYVALSNSSYNPENDFDTFGENGSWDNFGTGFKVKMGDSERILMHDFVMQGFFGNYTYYTRETDPPIYKYRLNPDYSHWKAVGPATGQVSSVGTHIHNTTIPYNLGGADRIGFLDSEAPNHNYYARFYYDLSNLDDSGASGLKLQLLLKRIHFLSKGRTSRIWAADANKKLIKQFFGANVHSTDGRNVEGRFGTGSAASSARSAWTKTYNGSTATRGAAIEADNAINPADFTNGKLDNVRYICHEVRGRNGTSCSLIAKYVVQMQKTLASVFVNTEDGAKQSKKIYVKTDEILGGEAEKVLGAFVHAENNVVGQVLKNAPMSEWEKKPSYKWASNASTGCEDCCFRNSTLRNGQEGRWGTDDGSGSVSVPWGAQMVGFGGGYWRADSWYFSCHWGAQGTVQYDLPIFQNPPTGAFSQIYWSGTDFQQWTYNAPGSYGSANDRPMYAIDCCFEMGWAVQNGSNELGTSFEFPSSSGGDDRSGRAVMKDHCGGIIAGVVPRTPQTGFYYNLSENSPVVLYGQGGTTVPIARVVNIGFGGNETVTYTYDVYPETRHFNSGGKTLYTSCSSSGAKNAENYFYGSSGMKFLTFNWKW